MPLRLLDLPGDARDHDIPAETHPRVAESTHRLHVAGERALHVRDADPVDASILDEPLGLQTANARKPRRAPRVGRVHVTVEHERLGPAGPFPEADDVRTPFYDPLPLHRPP